MKPPSKILIALTAAGACLPAHALVQTNPDSEIFITGTGTAQFNDNLFLSTNNRKSDTVYDLTPGVEWDFGKNSINSGKLSVGDDFQFFSRDSSLNTNLPAAGFTDAYVGQKTKLNVDLDYQKLDQATRDVRLVGTLIKRDWYHADATGEWAMSDKTSASVGAIYDDSEYHLGGFEDWRWVSIPLKYYYAVEPKLDVSAGFSYQDNVVQAPGIDSDEYFFNVGARGQFTGKLSGQFSVGYDQIAFRKGGRNTSGVGADAGFNYQATEKTAFTLGVMSGFGYSPQFGNSYRDVQPNAGFTAEISDHWTIGGQAGYGRFVYISSPQRDDYYYGQANLKFVMTQSVSFVGSYRYAEDDSNLGGDSFSNNIFTVGVNLKY